MFLKRTVIIVAGLIFGGATAAGVIALLTTLGFVSRKAATGERYHALGECHYLRKPEWLPFIGF